MSVTLWTINYGEHSFFDVSSLFVPFHYERDQIAVWNFQTGSMETFLISPEVMQMRS